MMSDEPMNNYFSWNMTKPIPLNLHPQQNDLTNILSALIKTKSATVKCGKQLLGTDRQNTDSYLIHLPMVHNWLEKIDHFGATK